MRMTAGHLGGEQGGGEGARGTRSVPSTGPGSSLTAGKPPSDSSPPRRAEHRHTGCRRRALPTPSTRLQAPAAQRGPGGGKRPGGETGGSPLPSPLPPSPGRRPRRGAQRPPPLTGGPPVVRAVATAMGRGGEGKEGKGRGQAAGCRRRYRGRGAAEPPGLGAGGRAGGGSFCPADRRKRGEERAHAQPGSAVSVALRARDTKRHGEHARGSRSVCV